ncbi:hypothetical protein HMPREF9595_01121 [Cutibacterium acnes HL005PA2]|nr:hypothetical protein HMPREF9595_01121 [Cutibacterium acnes HL005PA2]
MRGWFSLIAVKVEKKFVGCSHARLVQLNRRQGREKVCRLFPCEVGSAWFAFPFL